MRLVPLAAAQEVCEHCQAPTHPEQCGMCTACFNKKHPVTVCPCGDKCCDKPMACGYHLVNGELVPAPVYFLDVEFPIFPTPDTLVLHNANECMAFLRSLYANNVKQTDPLFVQGLYIKENVYRVDTPDVQGVRQVVCYPYYGWHVRAELLVHSYGVSVKVLQGDPMTLLAFLEEQVKRYGNV